MREMRAFWKSAIMQRLQPLQNPHFGSKIKIPKNMSKCILQVIWSCSVQKNLSKKHSIFDEWEDFENRPSCKSYSLCKILTLGQKLKFRKTSQNPFYKWVQVGLCKKPLEQTLNIREMKAFWWSAIKQRLYRSKIKIPKTCQNPFYNSFRVVLC